jgi:hypothetical protein
VAGGISPISSRNSVPVSASSKRPEPALRGAGERALLVAEQLALEQRLGERAHVHGDERARAPRRQAVDAARDQLLARAALPLDEHRARHRRVLLDLHEHLPDRLALAVQPRQLGEARRSSSRRAAAATSSATTGLG